MPPLYTFPKSPIGNYAEKLVFRSTNTDKDHLNMISEMDINETYKVGAVTLTQ